MINRKPKKILSSVKIKKNKFRNRSKIIISNNYFTDGYLAKRMHFENKERILQINEIKNLLLLKQININAELKKKLQLFL